ncbi:hypothetical protein [Pseudarthrobacter sp. PS3-L1]|uniref:hypothetical protein n=1 Tax=Pseudarthrobacter sp. PS3-L1 TaxID=3046207 RepID=UPI0024B8EE0D|nr:hypothetical protein [Pseudarthrobacter sp. PS3-L1]MDJ0321816.1 hypothetical protein [Pseudarthrobacter sp. PS3-L1]
MVYYLEDNPNPNTAQYGWPRTWVSGVVGVHTAESGVVPGGPDAGAENTAGFISRRSDYGSYHSLADYDSRIRLTRPTFAAWADTTNNVHALSVSGAMDAARWRDLTDERAAGIVRNMGIAAAELVQDAIAHGVLASPPPARRITAAEAIAGTRAGFYGHGETNPGTRYDPGTNFDWDLFLSTYAAAIGGTLTTLNSSITPILEDEMSAADVQAIRGDLATVHKTIINDVGSQLGGIKADIATVHNTIIKDVGSQLGGLREALKQVAAGQGVNLDMDAIQEAARKGAEDALKSGVVTVDVNVAGGK